FEEDSDSGDIQCILCMQYNNVEYAGKWMKRKSRKGHILSGGHQKSLSLRQSEQQEVETLQTIHRSQEEQFINARSDFAIPSAALLPIQHLPVTHHDISPDEEAMWKEYDLAENVLFEAGIDPGFAAEKDREAFERQAEEYGIWAGFETLPGDAGGDRFWDTYMDDLDLVEEMEDLVLEDKNLSESLPPSNAEADEWFPYPSKVIFLLDTIDNLPRLRMSGSLMKVVLWLLRELGVKHVPSFDALRKAQKGLQKKNGIPTVQWKSPKGNAFSFNDPCILVTNDWSNPKVVPYIRPYPVIPKDGVISEIWHARKWRHDCDRHILSPMWDGGNQHYYIDEPARLRNGKLVIPVRWVADESSGEVWADAWEIVVNKETTLATILDERIITIKSKDLLENFLNLEDTDSVPSWCPKTIDAGHATRIPNPDRKLAEGDPLYSSFIDLFGDDVSGNRSKSWNKHWNIYMGHRNLPRKLLQQQFHAGAPRTADETISEMKAQVHAACIGIAAPIERRQTDTGVKDAYTQYWIDKLIDRARDIRKTQRNRSPASIQEELIAWVNKNIDTIYNQFLMTE
ncbi:hypothetical protein H0H81_004167, partial [Sphagnurus paluster]